MYKSQIDELYHLLRWVSNESADQKSHEFADVIYGLSKHLLAGGDYLKLIQYSAYYGENFLLEPVAAVLRNTNWHFDRVVEFGAGLGWLGRGLAAKSGFLPTLFSDKRPWVLIDVVADLETENGRRLILEQMKPGDLVVASDLLHCLDDPEQVLSAFSEWPIAVLEYMPVNPEHAISYREQLKRYGGNPISSEDLTKMLTNLGRKVDIKDLDPYCLILIDKEE